MATLQTTDGRLLRASGPRGNALTGWMTPGSFPPMWSDGERWGDADTVLKSYEAIYRSQPIIAGVVDKLARRIATLPFGAYRKTDGNKELIEGDALDSLIQHPVPRTSRIDLLHHIGQSLLIHGNALVAKLRGPDREAPPIMLWPLDWAQVGAYAESGSRVEWWSTYQFGQQERFIAAEDTLHFAWSSPDGGEIGVSPLEKLGVTIKLEDAARRYQTSQFANGNRPSLMIAYEGNPNEQTLALARANMDQLHKGVDRSGKTMLLTGGAKVYPLSLSPVETALIDQRRVDREEVGMVYDLSGPLMNDLTHGTFSNVTELLRSLYRDILPPWTALFESTFQAQLLDQEPGWLDRFVSFDFTGKLRGEPLELAQSLKLQVEAGLITRNEARRILDMPPLDDEAADKATANVNNQAPLAAMAGPALPG